VEFIYRRPKVFANFLLFIGDKSVLKFFVNAILFVIVVSKCLKFMPYFLRIY
jgi:hypothetical protein